MVGCLPHEAVLRIKWGSECKKCTDRDILLVFNFKWIYFRGKEISLAELDETELFYLGFKEPFLFIFYQIITPYGFKSQMTLQGFI